MSSKARDIFFNFMSGSYAGSSTSSFGRWRLSCIPRLFMVDIIRSTSRLRHLERDGHGSRLVHCLAVACGGTETNLLRYPACLFIQAMAQALHYTQHDNLAIGRERNPQYHITLHLELLGLAGVLGYWL